MNDTCTAFAGTRRLASGARAEVALAVKAALAADPGARVLVFDDADGRPVDFDLRGDAAEVAARPAPAEPAPKRGPGRPKLGVSAREVTLLPRHWDWLAAQPGGASAALRRLVDAARRADAGPGRVRRAREAAYRVATALAGDAPAYEAAIRALYAGDLAGFTAATAGWPAEVRDHVRTLAGPGFEA